MLFFVGLAFAHVPHSVIPALASDPGLAEDLPWFCTHDYGGASELLESTDGGDTWSAVGGDPTRDVLLDAGWTNAGEVILLAEDRYWWSVDAGGTWNEAALDGVAAHVASGDGLAIATDDGLRVGGVGALETVGSGEAFVDVSFGPGGFAAVGQGVWVDGGVGAWAPIESPVGTVTRALAAPDAVYAGTADGSVWRWNGAAWSACGATPYAGADHPSVVALAADGSRLLVASAGRGPAVSTDQCRTWTDIAAPLDSSFGGAGGARDDDETTSTLTIAGDHIIQAGWAGFAFTTDGGATWTKRAVLAPDLLRGIAFSPDFDHDGVVLMGGFSGGVDRSEDGGRTWSSTGIGVPAPNIQQILYAPGDPQRVYIDANHTLARSRDGGRTWEDVDVACGSACHGWTVIADGSLWQAGVPVAGNAFGVSTNAAVSRDGGVTWSDVEGLDPGVEWDNFYDTTERLCVTGGDLLVCSADSGATWQTVSDSSDRVIAMLDVGEVELTAVEDQGIWRTVGGSAELVWDGSDDPVFTLSRADDDTLVATTRGARVLRSDDVGATWSDTGIDLPAAVPAVAVRPGFAAHPDVLLATYDGGWLYNADGDARFGRYERVDNSSGFAETEGVVTKDDPAAALGSCASMRPASAIRVLVRGSRVRVLGRAGGQSQAIVRIDGAQVATVGGSVVDDAQGEIWRSGALPDAWHHVEVAGQLGEDLCVDGIEATAEGAVLDVPDLEPDPGDTGTGGGRRCGCGDKGGGDAVGIVLIGLWAVGGRRRAR